MCLGYSTYCADNIGKVIIGKAGRRSGADITQFKIWTRMKLVRIT